LWAQFEIKQGKWPPAILAVIARGHAPLTYATKFDLSDLNTPLIIRQLCLAELRTGRILHQRLQQKHTLRIGACAKRPAQAKDA
jgi:hypothetical protein